MATKLTFKEVCGLIKKEHPQDSTLIDAVDKLLGVTFILSPIVFGPIGAPALALLGVKNELIKIGKSVYEKLAGKKVKDSLSREHRMEMAYCLICYTAFFDSLDEVLADARKELSLDDNVKLSLVDDCSLALSQETPADQPVDERDDTVSTYPIRLPHPIDDFEEQTNQLASLYSELAKGAAQFVEALAVWQDADEEARKRVLTSLESLPNIALERFRAQYFDLAARFEEFYVWSNLHEHVTTKRQLSNLSAYVKSNIALAEQRQGTVDLGLAKLENAVAAIPAAIERAQADHVVDGLGKAYKAAIEEPIVTDKYVPEEGKPALTFPRKSRIFVPQSFQVIRLASSDQHLEDEETWKSVKSRDTLGSFLFRFLSCPYSTEAPLIILGHPGSGKSLLTEILAARLVSPQLNPIRVALRDIDAESEIQAQIEAQIKKDTGREANWADLSQQFSQPPLIILDGYDELLQASGKVFRNYLIKVRDFQRREAVQGRPVRAIVTSRITLIDKADIPDGTTIIRLEEFDDGKRAKWIDVWNKANRRYFQESGVEAFELPDDKKILPLAAQPLLLLTLALYDSEGNRLRASRGLDQTLLYSRLLERFLERERMKDEEFQALKVKDRKNEINRDMQRLGVTAIGMFNRRSLHILSEDLNQYLAFFELEREIKKSASSGTEMTQADLLLGSFFFVHRSKTSQSSEEPEPHEVTTAFEFLHNTFGEFLTSDFVLRFVLRETQILEEYEKNELLKSELVNRLERADAFPDAWYTCLMFAPLYERPVILEMLREWAVHSLKASKRDRGEFLRHFDTIIANQVRRLLLRNTLPAVMRREDQTPFASMPLLGHIALYTLNLLVLRTILSTDAYVFDEELIDPHEGGARPWDQLTHLWRSWFSLDSLRGLAAIWDARRDGKKITIRAKKTFGVPSSADRLESVLSVSLALSDNVTSGLAGLITHDAFREGALELSDIEKRLDDEDIDVHLDVILRRLRVPVDPRRTYRERFEMIQEAFKLVDRSGDVNRSGMFDLLAIALFHEDRGFVGRIFNKLIHNVQMRKFGGRHPDLLLSLVRLGRLTGNQWWFHRNVDEVFEGILGRQPIWELGEEGIVECLVLAREAPWSRFSERIAHELFSEPRSYELLLGGPPRIAAEAIRFAREVGNSEWLNNASRDLIRQMIEQRFHRHDPELFAEIVKLVHETGSEQLLEQYAEEFVRDIVHREYRIHERSVHELVQLLPLLRASGNNRLREELLHMFMHEVRRDFEHLPPEIAVEMLRLGGGGMLEEWRERYPVEFFDRLIEHTVGPLDERFFIGLEVARSVDKFELFTRRFRVDAAGIAIRGDNLLVRSRWAGPRMPSMSDGWLSLDLSRLPLGRINDLRWMLRQIGDRRLVKEFERNLDSM